MPLKIKPCHLRAAREYVGRYHRHSIPPVGGKFAVACYDGDDLCGVAICGRPVARYLDDGLTLEVLRCQRQLENVIFRRDGMSFFGGQHAMGMQP